MAAYDQAAGVASNGSGHVSGLEDFESDAEDDKKQKKPQKQASPVKVKLVRETPQPKLFKTPEKRPPAAAAAPAPAPAAVEEPKMDSSEDKKQPAPAVPEKADMDTVEDKKEKKKKKKVTAKTKMTARPKRTDPVKKSVAARVTEVIVGITGGKEAVSGTGKRHRNFRYSDSIQGITKPAIRRMARRGGVKRMSGDVYGEIRGVLRKVLTPVIETMIALTQYKKQSTVTAAAALYALKKHHMEVWGAEVGKSKTFSQSHISSSSSKKKEEPAAAAAVESPTV